MKPDRPKSSTLLADLGLIYAAAIWGSTFFIVKGALVDISPVMLVAYRFVIAGLIMLAIIKLKGLPAFTQWRQGVVLGVILGSLYLPQTIGLKYTTASNSGFITGLFVAFVPLFERTIFGRKPKLMEVVSAIVAIIGMWVLTGGLTDVNLGDLLTIIAAVTYALHVLYADRYIKSGTDPYVISWQQFIVVGLMGLVAAALTRDPLSIPSGSTWTIILFLTLFPTLSAFVIQLVAQKIAPPIRVSIIFAFEPVFAALFAWTLGGEQFVLHRAAGGLLIFLALILSGLPSPIRNRQ